MRLATPLAGFAGLSALAALAAGPAAAQNRLVLTGVVDGPLTGGLPKAVELFVLQDVDDLSRYGLGSANNGGGSAGAEFTFPPGPATAGDFLYVSSPGDGVAGFTAFFGFPPDFSGEVANINGDDAIELFYDANGDATFDASEVADVFGEIAVDGTGQPWEHTDGWTYRADGTGPDGATFVLANWTFSGIDALDGATTNATAATPFPIGTYTPGAIAGEPGPASALALAVPNPVAGVAAVRYTASPGATLALYSVTGRRVARLDARGGAATLDARALAPGAYVLRLESADGALARLVTVVR